MIKIGTIEWFGRWGTSVFSENTAIFSSYAVHNRLVQYTEDRL